MTRSSQKFDMDYGIGHDVIVFFDASVLFLSLGVEMYWQ